MIYAFNVPFGSFLFLFAAITVPVVPIFISGIRNLYIQEKNRILREKQVSLKKEQQSQTLASRRQQTLSLQENMQKDLHTYETLMDNGQFEEAARYLEKLTSTFQKERFHPICGDNLINAILDSKRQTASQYNIRTSFQLLLPEKMKIGTSDLSSIFFNLMDNGIESCQNSHSSDPFIQITVSQNANFLTIHMTNSKDPSYKFNHKTNKTDSWAHGFGLAIIEEIASKYDGSCQWIDGGDVFESVVMVEVMMLPQDYLVSFLHGCRKKKSLFML